jgi:hypothetical protein
MLSRQGKPHYQLLLELRHAREATLVESTQNIEDDRLTLLPLPFSSARPLSLFCTPPLLLYNQPHHDNDQHLDYFLVSAQFSPTGLTSAFYPKSHDDPRPHHQDLTSSNLVTPKSEHLGVQPGTAAVLQYRTSPPHLRRNMGH